MDFLLAPTFVHGQGFGFRLRTKLLKLAGLQIYHKWDAQAYVDFVSQQGFSVTEQVIMGSRIAPTMLPGGAAKEHDIKRLKGSTA